MTNVTAIDRLRAMFRKTVDDQEYEPLGDTDDDVRRPVLVVPDDNEQPFSWLEYSVFFLLGIAMLWAWNMFLAAAPYFQNRFKDDAKILSHFQSAIISVATITNLSSTLLLSNMQRKASYPKRIVSALGINVVVFTLLSISTSAFRNVSESGYLAFTLMMVFSTSVATGLVQNGAFAFASSFGQPSYTQAIMTGQAVAGVLPSVAQILSVLALPVHDYWAEPEVQATALANKTTTSAFIYFLTATAISVMTLLATLPLIRKHKRLIESQMMSSIISVEETEQAKRKSVGMWTLYKKLHWLAAAVFMCFAITMFFPVFTQKIVSVIPEDRAPSLFQPSTFIPLGFLVWNLGDLFGRLLTAIPVPTMSRRPWLIFVFSLLRGGHLPLYLLCNIEGKGAKIESDLFYLFVVQFAFGMTNGWLAGLCMMGANNWVEEDEREASGGFMVVNLVAGLTAGSLLSFAASGA